jgi:hypothetical protein
VPRFWIIFPKVINLGSLARKKIKKIKKKYKKVGRELYLKFAIIKK